MLTRKIAAILRVAFKITLPEEGRVVEDLGKVAP